MPTIDWYKSGTISQVIDQLTDYRRTAHKTDGDLRSSVCVTMDSLIFFALLVASVSPIGHAEAKAGTMCGEISMESFCTLQPVPGPCKSTLTRYFYNTTSGVCQSFTYSGCRGNVNNFESEQQCQDVCQNDTSGATLQSLHDTCFLQLSDGQGTKAIENFYYDAGLKKCLPFEYKGSGGNQNRFDSWRACWDKCKGVNSGDVCELAQSETSDMNCMGFFQRFRYNTMTSQCEEFVYGGCCPTANNFRTKEQCRKICFNR